MMIFFGSDFYSLKLRPLNPLRYLPIKMNEIVAKYLYKATDSDLSEILTLNVFLH